MLLFPEITWSTRSLSTGKENFNFFSPGKLLSRGEVSLVRGHPYCPTRTDHPGLSPPSTVATYTALTHPLNTSPNSYAGIKEVSTHLHHTAQTKCADICIFPFGRQITNVLQQSQMHTNTQKRPQKAPMWQNSNPCDKGTTSAPKGWWINSQHWEREKAANFVVQLLPPPPLECSKERTKEITQL